MTQPRPKHTMNTPNHAGPAFPSLGRVNHDNYVDNQAGNISMIADAIGLSRPGMSLRDYFAAQALGSVLQSSGDLSSYYDYTAGSKGDSNIPSPKGIAAYSYELSDAMLAAREAKP